MKKKHKLVSMVQYILDIDFLSTIEFCDTFGVPHPVFTGEVKSTADQFLQIDAIKNRLFKDYAKFLNQPLNLKMFVGDNAIFNGFYVAKTKNEYIDVLKKEENKTIYAYIDMSEFKMNYPHDAKRIVDLVNYIEEYEK